MTKLISVLGLVQGVGFRPFVLRLSQALNIKGFVKNKGAMVEIIAQGEKQALEDFIQRLACCLPDGAEVWKITEKDIAESKLFSCFSIDESSEENDMLPLVMPDIATCPECERQLFTAGNRRYMHPFISCTVCGPRYSITNGLPYDRCRTSMKAFELCRECEEEYGSPDNERCYAQTIACNECGPQLFYTNDIKNNPIESAAEDLKNGRIIAIKDIGGFHFACNPFDENAVNRLRALKLRKNKPFAVMFRDADLISGFAYMNEAEKKLLESSARPIVLLRKKNKAFPPDVCDASADLGAMLPCNPVQLMLLKKCPVLIMTSGNISDEPIITENEAVLELAETHEYLDGVLYHNRDILTPLDDSIVRIICGKMQIIRRARGYTPLPIMLEGCSGSEVFAAGADLKSSFCFIKGNAAYMSQHFGDLESEEAYSVYCSNIERMKNIMGFSPSLFACDKHPDYYSSVYNESCLKIQHHYAHIASVIAEHNLNGKVLGFAFDGTGFGEDYSVWGGEVLICDSESCIRAEHLREVVFFGADSISREPRKALNCYLYAMGKNFDPMVGAALDNNIGSFVSTSAGRLFDAVASLIMGADKNSYEGEAAVRLEALAATAEKAFELSFDNWNWEPLFAQIFIAVNSKVPKNEIALGFHLAIAKEILATAKRFRIKQTALSGGVFANRILTEAAVSLLKENGFQVYFNEKVPMNDGGIALGQAYLAACSEKYFIGKE